MASWKVKGYVSDSEDDEDEADHRVVNGLANTAPKATAASATLPSLDTLRRHHTDLFSNNDANDHQAGHDKPIDFPRDHTSLLYHSYGLATAHDAEQALNKPLQSTAQKLEKSLADGLALIRSIRSLSPSPRNENLVSAEDNDDSPLSSPPKSPDLQPEPVEASVPVHPELEKFPSNLVPQRSLRQRTANQLHPYSIEFAKYSKTLTDRGLRPLRVALQSTPGRTRAQEESQDSQFDDDTQTSEIPSDDFMEIGDIGANSHGQNMWRDETQMPFANDDFYDDELPDLEQMLQDRKRRDSRPKTKSTPRQTGQHRGEIFGTTSFEPDGVRNKSSGTAQLNRPAQQDSLPSPPRSMSIEIGEFEELPDLIETLSQPVSSPLPLPTPLLSSEMRPRKRRVIEDDSQSAEDLPIPPAPASSTDSGSDSELDHVEPVQIMQKRVKGVLPASWWNIDRAQQELVKRQTQASRKKSSLQNQAGVAKRTSKTKTSHGTAPPFMIYEDLFSDQSSDDSTEVRRHLNERGQNLHEEDLELMTVRASPSVEAIEILDGDGIDMMLPANQRNSQSRKSRQSKLDFSLTRKKPLTISSYKTSRSTGTASATRKPRKKRQAQTDLRDVVHVLDAPDLRNSTLTPKSTFLRVAARQARHKPYTAGIKASQKFFQLQNEDDSVDILEEFRGRKSYQHPVASREDLTSGKATRTAQLSTGKPHHTANSVHSRHVSGQQKSSRYDESVSLEGNVQAMMPTTVVECGETEAHDLRLTRLRALLPLSNRSGLGRLAVNQIPSRAAQIEELHQPRPLARNNAKRPIPQRSIKKVPVLQEIPANEVQPNQVTPPIAVPKNAGRRPKQIPIRRPLPKQTLLVQPEPDTDKLKSLVGHRDPSVRQTLEEEFAKCQSSWFQGSKVGISMANDRTQAYFHTFLDVLRSYVPAALEDSEDGQESRELRSFMHRIVPNRGQIGAQGQIGDKTLDVLEYDILVARNVFDLHTCLLSLAPGYAPATRVLEMKVNFADAHHEICLIALSAWTTIFEQHHTETTVVEGLARWMQTMLLQLQTRWKYAEVDARTEAERAIRRIDERVIRKVIEHNREQTTILILKAVANFDQAISSAVSVTEFATILQGVDLVKVLNTYCTLHELEHTVFIALLGIITSSVSHRHTLNDPSTGLPSLGSMRHVISSILVTNSSIPGNFAKSIARSYFTIAEIAVQNYQRSWERIFDPRSSDSPDMFISEPHLSTMKALLYQLLLEKDASSYMMDLRPMVLTHWLYVLLQSSDDDMIAVSLTAGLFEVEKESLEMHSLASRFQLRDMDGGRSLTEPVSEIRHATILHLISVLHRQELSSEAEWLAGGLDDSDAAHLLKVIFSTMKERWVQLSEQPEEQDLYTLLIHAALEQYARYPRTDFTVEPWFFNSATFPQPKNQDLVKLLTQDPVPDQDWLSEMRETFEAEIQHARRYDRFSVLTEELKMAFIPGVADVESNSMSAAVVTRQEGFVKHVVVSVLQQNDKDIYDTRTMLLDVLVFILEHFECRYYADGEDGEMKLLQAIFPIVKTFGEKLVHYTDSERDTVYKITRLTFEWAIASCGELTDDFLGDVEGICDYAAQHDTDEALQLLRTVVRCM